MSVKEKFYLSLFGAALGGICVAMVYFGWRWYIEQPDNRTSFSSVSDLRHAIAEGGEKQEQDSSGSVPLRQIIAPHPSDVIMYDLLPGLDVLFQRSSLRTNACGMRDEEHSIAKPENTFRIALLGDSYAFGWGVEREESFAFIFEKELSRLLSGRMNVEVLNFAVPGYSTFQQVALFEEKGMDFQVDAVLVYFVENDFGLPFFIKSLDSERSMVGSPSFARKAWRGEDKQVQARHDELVGMLDPNDSLRRLAQRGKQRGMYTFVAINPRRDWKKDKARLWVLREEKYLRAVHLRRGLQQLIESREIADDDLTLGHDPHPSAVKHRILGEVLAAELWPFIDFYSRGVSQ